MIELFRLLIALTVFTFFGFLIFEFRSFRFNLLNIPLYLALAIPSVSLVYFFLRFFNIPAEIISLLLILSCMIGFVKTTFITLEVKKEFLFFILFLLVGSLILGGSSFFEGQKKEGNILIITTKDHDALWHIALEESIKKSIPPDNPIFAPEKLKNYHYLTDVFLSFLSQLTNISTVNLFLRRFPFILSFLFLSTTYLLFHQLTKSSINSYLGSSLVLFSSSLSYLAPIFFKNASIGQSIFWLDQPTRYLVNPQLALSLIMMNIIFLLILKSLRGYWLIIAILLGSLVGIKVYGFIVLLIAFCLAGFFYYFKERQLDYLKITLLSLSLALVILVFAGTSSGFPFIFQPGWFIGSMYQAADRLNYPEWEIHRQLFLENSNYRRLIIHWVVGILIFFVGNFGLKIIGFPISMFYLKRVRKLEPILFFSIICLLVSLILPMLFLQKGVVWNTIQFMHYAQVPLVISIIYMLRKFTNKYQLIVLLTILIIGLPTTLIEVKQSFQTKTYSSYSKEFLDGLNMVTNLTARDDIIFVGSGLYGSSAVPAFTKRAVFYADQGIIDILRIDSLTRVSYIDKVEKGVEKCKSNEIFLFAEKPASMSGQIIFRNNRISIVKCLN